MAYYDDSDFVVCLSSEEKNQGFKGNSTNIKAKNPKFASTSDNRGIYAIRL